MMAFYLIVLLVVVCVFFSCGVVFKEIGEAVVEILKEAFKEDE